MLAALPPSMIPAFPSVPCLDRSCMDWPTVGGQVSVKDDQSNLEFSVKVLIHDQSLSLLPTT